MISYLLYNSLENLNQLPIYSQNSFTVYMRTYYDSLKLCLCLYYLLVFYLLNILIKPTLNNRKPKKIENWKVELSINITDIVR